MTLDQCLTFNNHVNSLTSGLMKKLAIIGRIKHLLDKTTLFIVINSLVFSKLYYCFSVLVGTSKSNIAKLQLVQNFAARLFSGKRKFDHISPTLRKLKLLPVSDILHMRDAVQMYKCVNGLAPHYLTLWSERGQTSTVTTLARIVIYSCQDAARHLPGIPLPIEV